MGKVVSGRAADRGVEGGVPRLTFTILLLDLAGEMTRMVGLGKTCATCADNFTKVEMCSNSPKKQWYQVDNRKERGEGIPVTPRKFQRGLSSQSRGE